jgi:SAM-dependent methyltransferase
VKCCSCGGAAFGDVIDLGLMPLVNNLLSRPDEPCGRWPLKVVYCRACSLAQLTETPPPEAMFGEYLYFSSQSQTMLAHAGELVRRFVRPGDRVIEVASNDGYLLSQAQAIGAKVLGVDPARNIAAYANERGVPTRCEFFHRESAATIASEWGRCDVLFANNVLAHVPNPNEIAAGVRAVLAPEGRAHIEMPYVRRMIDAVAFDTIYHEHRCYFSVAALQHLFARHDLAVTDVEIMPIHGGSLHLELRHRTANVSEEKANAMVAEERAAGIFEDRFYADFAERVAKLRSRLLSEMSRFRTVAAYGAAAKGIVLLNYFGLDSQRVPFVADVSPHKQGRHVPGTRQEIVPPSVLVERKPDAALLLPWNITEEIVRSNRAYLEQGGHFIVPIPEVTIL